MIFWLIFLSALVVIFFCWAISVESRNEELKEALAQAREQRDYEQAEKRKVLGYAFEKQELLKKHGLQFQQHEFQFKIVKYVPPKEQ